MNPRSIGPDRKPLIGPEPGISGPDLGMGWSGIEEKEVELSKADEARSRPAYGSKAVERGLVVVLALTAAPEMDLNVVVAGVSSEWTLDEEFRVGSGRT